MECVEQLARVGAALGRAGGPRGALRAAWEELRGIVRPREACLEVRIAGRLHRFGVTGELECAEVFALGRGGRTRGALMVGRWMGGREEPLGGRERRALQVAAVLVGLFVENLDLAGQAAAGPELDALTGCTMRREGMERIGAEVRRARAQRCGASLIFLDVDHLKGLNDRYGHRFGDAVLAAVGRVLREGLRGADLRCRYGGDEFVVLLPDTRGEDAVRVAEKLRGRLAGQVPGAPDGGGVAAASFGVSTTVGGEGDADTLVARADAAMYRAKRDGGDAVRVWREDPEWRLGAGAGAAAEPVAGI